MYCKASCVSVTCVSVLSQSTASANVYFAFSHNRKNYCSIDQVKKNVVHRLEFMCLVYEVPVCI